MILGFYDLEQLKSEKISFVIGSFDLLHPGHIHFLKKAKEVAPENKLLVGIISDKYVSLKKGDTRPIVPDIYRSEILNELKVVDYVFIAPEIPTGDVSKKVLEMVKPKVAVATKSAWENRENPFEVTGTKLVLIEDEIAGFSTTNVIEKVRGSFNYNQPFVVVGGLLEKDGKYLLVHESHGPARGLWNIPAGKWDAGESLLDGAVREVREETGFEFKPENILGIYARHRNNNSVLQVIFTGNFDEKKLEKTLDVEEVKWFAKDEIFAMDTDTLRSGVIKEMISDYEDGRKNSLKILSEFFG